MFLIPGFRQLSRGLLISASVKEMPARRFESCNQRVGLLERGERKPTIDVAERVARALGRKLSTLIAEAERKSVKKI